MKKSVNLVFRSADERPEKSLGEVLVITSSGHTHISCYSKIHDKFGFFDDMDIEEFGELTEFDKYVTFWVDVSEIVQEVES